MSIEEIKKAISSLLQVENLAEKISLMNELREHIHTLSPFKNEPVDYVKWIPCEMVTANDYNPNKVAPPEMELLEISIMNDGYTQPVVTFPKGDNVEVVDGFHRTRVSKESKVVRERVMGYTPTVIIRKEQSDKNDRIASTIRHNRARGKHQVDAMSEIVIELKNRNWTNARISRELGMNEEEVLRLCQISGLEVIFSDNDFSKAWVATDDAMAAYEPISDDTSNEELEMYRIPNEGDETRIFHTYDKWECHKAGFYASKKSGMTAEQCEQAYYNVLSNDEKFKTALDYIINNWKYSCEHYLTNKSMNRIAWLGQASVCYLEGVPSKYCGGFYLLSDEQQKHANIIAHEYLNKWLAANGLEQTTIDEALLVNRQVELY